MDKRTITALILMLLVFLVFDQFVWKPARVTNPPIEEEATKDEAPAAVVDSVLVRTDSEIRTSSSKFVESARNNNINISNDLVRITFDNMGAQITHVELMNFKMRDGSNVQLIPENHAIAGINLIHPGMETPLHNEVFSYHQISDRKVIFYLSTDKDSVITKTFTLNDDYGVDLDVVITDFVPVSGLALSFEAGISQTEQNLKTKVQDYKFYLFADNTVLKLDMKKLKQERNMNLSSFTWAAIRSKYFTLAVLEKEPALTKRYLAMNNEETDSPSFVLESSQKNARSDWQQSYTLFLGPADSDLLKSYGNGMDNIAELGSKWLRWLSNIFAWFLKFLHRYIKNYGVVIIIFSLILKLVLHPLTHKQLSSSLKMQKLQPQVQQIQQQYKNDPKRAQAEVAALYKEAGTNPISGCMLPMLIQMPIFISLYNVLRYSLDMRNAHFVGWLTDLSEPDPYMILPILMGVFMILQSLLMQPPKQNLDEMDDKQKAAAQSSKMMMWVMPIFMFFIFRNMPAGLVLYWTIFNVFSVIQQYYLQKHLKQKDTI